MNKYCILEVQPLEIERINKISRKTGTRGNRSWCHADCVYIKENERIYKLQPHLAPATEFYEIYLEPKQPNYYGGTWIEVCSECAKLFQKEMEEHQ